MKVNNDCIYRKVGKRYHPIGVCEPINYIPDGIWYVRHKEHSRATTNCEYIGEMLKIGDSEDISMNIQCGLENLCDYVFDSKEYKEALNKKEGYSLNDVTHAIVKAIYNRYKS